jgi:hypothetical protein
VLRKQEKGKINRLLGESADWSCLNASLDQAHLLDPDTVRSIFKGGLAGWANFHKRTTVPGFYTFSRPIFLRNKKVAIFYSNYSCGYFCGDRELTAFKKITGRWTKWIVLKSWVT